jgi:hypothetical protein
MDNEEYQEILEDMRDECCKFGMHVILLAVFYLKWMLIHYVALLDDIFFGLVNELDLFIT